MDEPTAWEDINPAMALVPRAEQRFELSRLEPARPDELRDQLESCLGLVAPVGMGEAERMEWFALAGETVGHLPADLLAIGCQKARETCDHFSKIVPTIIAETQPFMTRRRDAVRDTNLLPPPSRPRPLLDRRGEAMTDEETNELNELLAGLGAVARYRSDGSRYTVETHSKEQPA